MLARQWSLLESWCFTLLLMQLWNSPDYKQVCDYDHRGREVTVKKNYWDMKIFRWAPACSVSIMVVGTIFIIRYSDKILFNRLYALTSEHITLQPKKVHPTTCIGVKLFSSALEFLCLARCTRICLLLRDVAKHFVVGRDVGALFHKFSWQTFIYSRMNTKYFELYYPV